MNSLYEHLNDELERQDGSFWSAHTSPDLLYSLMPAPNSDQEVHELVAVARSIQMASAVQVDPDFAERLEQRMLVHNAMRRFQQPQYSWWSWLSLHRMLHVHPAIRVALSCCLLVVLLSIGVLIASAQVSDPNNPLYALNQWEQNVRISLSGSSSDRAELDLQFANNRLNTLIDLANASDARAYEQQLVALNQQIYNAVQSLNQVPAGGQRDQPAREIATFEMHARHILRGLLPRLNLEERLATTNSLGGLGDNVPHLQSVQINPPTYPGGLAIIRITGSDLQSGVQLIIDGQLVEASGSLQNGAYIFLVSWTGSHQAQSIGILNPDNTTVQTSTITVYTSGSNGNGNGHSSGNGHSKGCLHGNSCHAKGHIKG
jgi:hypothetical protein